MQVLVSGSGGFIGSALVSALRGAGHGVRSLVRQNPDPGAGRFHWDPTRGELDRSALDGIDAVVHLAGENVAGGRWTAERMASIRDSRIQGTGLLARATAASPARPRVFLSASAIGFYGDRGSEWLTESSPRGSGFLAEVCEAWESASDPASVAGIRRVCLRFGIVLAPHGGALARMLPLFRWGLGGVLGGGGQYMSWITLADVVRAVIHALSSEALGGPVNLVAPSPVTNREFTRALGSAVHRPAFLPVPAFAARLAFGRMADEALLASARVRPGRLMESGFTFLHPGLQPALVAMLFPTPPAE